MPAHPTPSATAPLRFGANHVPSSGWFYSWLDFDADQIARDFDDLAGLGLDHVRIFPVWPWIQPNRSLIRSSAVEDVLITHPAVEGCAVVGVPHPYSGEAVKAFVVVNDSVSVEEDEIIAWCADRLARYKCPDKVMFVDHLPVGLSGKVLRRELAAIEP